MKTFHYWLIAIFGIAFTVIVAREIQVVRTEIPATMPEFSTSLPVGSSVLWQGLTNGKMLRIVKCNAKEIMIWDRKVTKVYPSASPNQSFMIPALPSKVPEKIVHQETRYVQYWEYADAHGTRVTKLYVVDPK